MRSKTSPPAAADMAAYCNQATALRITGLKRDTFARLQKTDPTFPHPVPITDRIKLYSVPDLLAWVESRRKKPPLPPLRPTAEKGTRHVPRR